MDLEKLQTSLECLEEYEQYIAKANSQKGKFPLSVVQKVILNYELRMEVELDKARPMIVALNDECQKLSDQIESIRAQAEAPEELQEIELMYTIGALAEEDYRRQKNEIEQNHIAGDEQELQRDLDSLMVYLDRWNQMQGSENSYSEPEHSAEKESEATSAQLESEPSHSAPIELPEEQEVIPPPPPLPERIIPEIEVEEDSISEVQAFPEPTADELVIEEPFAEHETFLVDDVEPELGDRFLQDSFVEEESDFGSLGEELPLELEEEPAPDLEIMPSSFDTGSMYEEAPVSNEIRSAILLKNEGASHEEVFTFAGEQYSIGRHQDNNIQIKGDTKVSRFHCKLFRRNGHFYIEDQHSSNGTLVNGELISERRLYGGEELKIGETLFRFRLQ
jgi:hypothetical protein